MNGFPHRNPFSCQGKPGLRPGWPNGSSGACATRLARWGGHRCHRGWLGNRRDSGTAEQISLLRLLYLTQIPNYNLAISFIEHSAGIESQSRRWNHKQNSFLSSTWLLDKALEQPPPYLNKGSERGLWWCLVMWPLVMSKRKLALIDATVGHQEEKRGSRKKKDAPATGLKGKRDAWEKSLMLFSSRRQRSAAIKSNGDVFPRVVAANQLSFKVGDNKNSKV